MKKISILISIVLISLIAISAVSAAEDLAVADGADLAAQDEVQVIEDTAIDDTSSSNTDDILADDTGDSGDSDTDDADDGDEGDDGDEPTPAVPGTFTDLETLINGTDVLLTLENDFNMTTDERSAYNNGIVISKDIVIDGQGHVIDANGFGVRTNVRIFTIEPDVHVLLHNITFVNGHTYSDGGAILNNGFVGISSCTFENCSTIRFLFGSAGKGGAIFNSATGEMTIADCDFNSNDAEVGGGAIHNDGKMTIVRSDFTSNDAVGGTIFAAAGGAIYNNGELNITDCGFTDNAADRSIQSGGEGGAIYNTEAGTLQIFDSDFEGNEGIRAGGAIYNLGEMLVDESIFYLNGASGGLLVTANGGAIYNGGSATILDNYFDDNSADRGETIYNDGELSLNENDVDQEGATIYNAEGGELLSNLNAIVLDGTDHATQSPYFTLYGVLTDDNGNLIEDREFTFLVEDNVAPFRYFNQDTGVYNVTYYFPEKGTYIVDADFGRNVAVTPGKVYYQTTLINLQELVDAADDGDRILLYDDYKYFEEFDAALKETGVVVNKTLTIKGNGATISGSEESRLFKVGQEVELELNDLTIVDGVGTMYGGAIVSEGFLSLINCVIANNTAVSVDDATAAGGAIFAGDALYAENTIFAENECEGHGGALYLLGANAFFENVTFYLNYAYEGGAIATFESDIDLYNTFFVNNFADKFVYNIYQVSEKALNMELCTFYEVVPEVELEEQYTFGDVINISGTCDFGVNKYPINMTYTIDGVEYTTEVIDGKFNILIDNQPDVGVYNLGIVNFFDEDANYYYVEPLLKSFNVEKATPIVEVTSEPVLYGEPATVNVKVSYNDMYIDGDVVITVDWEVDGLTEVVSLEDGAGEATFRLDPYVGPGQYTITAKYLGNRNFEEVVNNTEKVVINPSRDVTIDVVGGLSEIVVNVTDATGAPVEGAINVSVNGADPVEVELVDGIATIPDTLGGEKEVTVSYPGSEAFDPKEVTETVTVIVPAQTETVITVTATNVSYGDEVTIDFTLKDINGNPLDGTLNVTVGDEEMPVTVTAGVGQVKLSNLNADTYPVVANFAGIDSFLPSTGTGSFNVAKNATMIIYEDMNTTAVDYYKDGRVGEYFRWRLVDANGNPLANTPMLIGFNGVVYDEKNGIVTDEDGWAQLQINLMRIDVYTFAVCYLGDVNRNGSFVVARINVIGQTPTITVPNKSYAASAKTKTITATFKSNKGTLINNKKITFTVNGVSYSAKTNDKGVASVNVNIAKKGTYAVTVKFAGDNTYTALTQKATLKIT